LQKAERLKTTTPKKCLPFCEKKGVAQLFRVLTKAHRITGTLFLKPFILSNLIYRDAAFDSVHALRLEIMP